MTVIILVLGGYHTAVTLWGVLLSVETAASQRAVVPVNICSEGTLGPFMRKVPCKCEILPPLEVLTLDDVINLIVGVKPSSFPVANVNSHHTSERVSCHHQPIPAHRSLTTFFRS